MINFAFNVRIQETRAIRSGHNVRFLRDAITIRHIKAEIIAIASAVVCRQPATISIKIVAK